MIARVTNDKGVTFNVRLVRKGDNYGRRDVLVHDKDDPMVEFYDATHENDERFFLGRGQFVSRYYVSTFTGAEGLILAGDVPVWTVTAANCADVEDGLREAGVLS